MDVEHLFVMTLVLVIGTSYVLNRWFRYRLLLKQLDVLTIAIEKGVDPEQVKDSLAVRDQSGNINGNWKAGMVLTWVGFAFFIVGLPGAVQDGNIAWFLVLVFPLTGIALLNIHKRIVGKVVKHERTPVDDKPQQ